MRINTIYGLIRLLQLRLVKIQMFYLLLKTGIKQPFNDLNLLYRTQLFVRTATLGRHFKICC